MLRIAGLALTTLTTFVPVAVLFYWNRTYILWQGRILRYLLIVLLIATLFPANAAEPLPEPRTSVRTSETIKVLRNQLAVKDQQIGTLNKTLEKLVERDQEANSRTSETIKVLRNQLAVKDQQIATLNKTLEKLVERDQEANSLTRVLQDLSARLTRTLWGMTGSEWAAVFTALFASVAGFALLYAAKQVRQMRQQTSGHFLFELEARWSSNKLEEGQHEIVNLLRQVPNHVQKRYAHLDAQRQREKTQRLYVGILSRMRRYDLDRYRKIVLLLEYFEMMKVIIDTKALDFDTAMQLYGGWPEAMNEICRQFIEEVIRAEDVGAYMNATRLFDDAKVWIAEERRKYGEKKERPSWHSFKGRLKILLQAR